MVSNDPNPVAGFGLRANQRATYDATFRVVAKKYPYKAAGEILANLVKTTPGDEGKWFAAAKDTGSYSEALALASRTPCDPKLLTRAARDYAEKQATGLRRRCRTVVAALARGWIRLRGHKR